MTDSFEIMGNGWVRINCRYINTDKLSSVEMPRDGNTRPLFIACRDVGDNHYHFNFDTDEQALYAINQFREYLLKEQE